MTFYGMDTEQGMRFGDLLGSRSGDLADTAGHLDGRVAALGGFWVGPDADAFADRWNTLRSGPVNDLVDRLMELARTVYDEAEAQDLVSVADAAEALGELLGRLFRPSGWPSLLPSFNDWEDWVGTGLSGVIDFASQGLNQISKFFLNPRNLAAGLLAGGDDMLAAMQGIGSGASRIAKFLGPVGAVVTAGFAGWDRWEQDSQDPSLNTGERIGRAAIDGGLNAAVGGLGAVGGAAIGTLICPGVGTVIGGVIGGFAGTTFGNGIADWLLG